MRISVEQSLVDSGDSLALSMVNEGASVFKLKPVDEWEWTIYKVIYYSYGKLGDIENSIIGSIWYILSTDFHIDVDVERFSPDCSWMSWDPIEEVMNVPRRHSEFGHENYGYGKYRTVEELKRDYRIRR